MDTLSTNLTIFVALVVATFFVGTNTTLYGPFYGVFAVGGISFTPFPLTPLYGPSVAL